MFCSLTAVLRLVAALLVSFSSAALPAAAQVVGADSSGTPPPVVGAWVLADVPEGALPCSAAGLEYREDGVIVAFSGEQRIEGQYVAVPRGAGYVIGQWLTGHNGKPNCQGYSADFVMENNIPIVYVEAEGDEARMYFSSGPEGRFARLVRQAAE